MFEINGKPVTLKLDFGGVKMLKREYGVDILQMREDEMADIDVFTAILYVLAVRGGSEITMEDIDAIDMRDMDAFLTAVGESIGEFSPEAKEGDDDPLAEMPPQ